MTYNEFIILKKYISKVLQIEEETIDIKFLKKFFESNIESEDIRKIRSAYNRTKLNWLKKIDKSDELYDCAYKWYKNDKTYFKDFPNLDVIKDFSKRKGLEHDIKKLYIDFLIDLPDLMEEINQVVKDDGKMISSVIMKQNLEGENSEKFLGNKDINTQMILFNSIPTACSDKVNFRIEDNDGIIVKQKLNENVFAEVKSDLIKINDKNNKVMIVDKFSIENRINEYIHKNKGLGKDSIITIEGRKALYNSLNLLSKVDRQILGYIISRADESSENYIYYGEIKFNIIDIVKEIYSSYSSKQYKKVEDSINKMSELNIKYNGENGVTNISIIDFSNIDGDGVVVRLGSVLREELRNMRTVRIYNKILDKLQEDVSYILIFALQERRLRMAIECNRIDNGEFSHLVSDEEYKIYKETGYLIFTVEYLYFTNILYYDMKYKRKKAFINLISKGLQELKENNILIEEFYIKNDFITIKFKAFSNKEQKIIQNEANPFAYALLDE
ncbi:hypothetical protein [Clostridium perfringens]|uniref:hypothetical protein n=1 Tax=Clostridium perfringens TaxID=1502 RepID=UPI003D3263A4